MEPYKLTLNLFGSTFPPAKTESPVENRHPDFDIRFSFSILFVPSLVCIVFQLLIVASSALLLLPLLSAFALDKSQKLPVTKTRSQAEEGCPGP